MKPATSLLHRPPARSMQRRMATAALAACAIVTAPGVSLGQSFPARPITLVVPYTPGGTTDNIVRAIQKGLSDQLGQPVIIDNRPGASGNVGNRSVARATPDGYTLGIMPTTVGTFPLMSSTMGYDPMTDLSFVGTVAETPSILIVRKDSPIRDFPALVALARAKSGGINVGSGGVGGAGHLVIMALGKLNGFAVTHIAYKGTAPAVSDLLGDSIDAASMAIGGVKGQVEGGIVRPILVASTRRSPLIPEVPVIGEYGLKGVEGGVGYAIAVPAATPGEIIKRLHTALERVLQDPEVVERMRAISFVPVITTPEQARRLIEEQTATWAPVIRDLNLKLE